ncbi:hypothetical protein ABEG18_18090 [Alsobacter sp. KACC 23698]|uniref:DUF3592 domain-containing protein n=1 Tax=Alsobacter sp. KACC 23698 TaxID=3149229 RepID=A0AAU7JB81_9HYPH
MPLSEQLRENTRFIAIAYLCSALCLAIWGIGVARGHQRDLDRHLMFSVTPVHGVVVDIDKGKGHRSIIRFSVKDKTCFTERPEMKDSRRRSVVIGQSVAIWPRSETCYEPVVEGDWDPDMPKLLRGAALVGLGLMVLWTIALHIRSSLLQAQQLKASAPPC